MKKLLKKGASNISLQHKQKKICKRMFRFKSKASMTVEASLVVPIFLFVMINIISIISMYEIQSEASTKLYKEVKTLSIVYPGEYVKLHESKRIEPLVGIVGFEGFELYSYMQTRSWTGYDNENALNEGNVDETMVYVTKSGKVYHMSSQCTSLKLSLSAVYKKEVNSKRNNEGKKFSACEICGNKESSDIVYISKYGTKYHTTLECSTIKRTIEAIPISQVGMRKECSKCGGNQ